MIATATAPSANGSSRATQKNRLLALAVESLPPDALLLVSLEGQEAISSLYSFRLRCVSEVPHKIKLQKILEKAAAIRIRLNDGSQRVLSGIISRCSCDGRDVGGDDRFTHYTLEVVPWLWLLTRTTDCRIFQDKTAPEIIEAVFRELGFTDFQLSLSRSYVRRDYCVQYRESDFNFVSRLMEEEGIFYFFEHNNGQHDVVLADWSQAYQPCPHQESALYEPEQGIGDRDDRVTAWSEQREIRSGKFSYRDHHFQMPDKRLDFNAPTLIKVGSNERLEVYDYPGAYAPRFNKPEQRLGEVESLGDQYVKLRMEEEEAQHLVVHGKSSCRPFCTGTKFQIDAPSGLTSGNFVLTSVQHTARCLGTYTSGSATGEAYANEFTCIPADVPFRPRRQAQKPLIHGTQTAVVVGPPGEEIYPDKFGRVKVQFHWDRLGQRDEHSSCWIRVSQTHAAPGFGCISIPRIGEEVIVSFLEGDPDQPLIIGRVYNAACMPPFELPAGMTRSGIKSQTHKGAGYNEMTMDDTAGKEQIRIHGQYNMDTTIGNNETHTVGVDRTTKIGNNDVAEIGANQLLNVATNQSVRVGSNQSTTIGSNQQIDVGQNLVITAGTSITLRCGASILHMNQAGVIQLAGTMVTVAGAINTNITAPLTTVSGIAVLTGGALTVSAGFLNKVIGGTTTVEGTPVKINC